MPLASAACLSVSFLDAEELKVCVDAASPAQQSTSHKRTHQQRKTSRHPGQPRTQEAAASRHPPPSPVHSCRWGPAIPSTPAGAVGPVIPAIQRPRGSGQVETWAGRCGCMRLPMSCTFHGRTNLPKGPPTQLQHLMCVAPEICFDRPARLSNLGDEDLGVPTGLAPRTTVKHPPWLSSPPPILEH